MATEQEGHTPGTWVAEGADVFGDHNIILRDGEDRRAVAAVVSNMRDPSEVAANARLIAAAPDLIKAGKDAEWFLALYAEYVANVPVDEIERHPYLPDLQEKLEALRAAIARATGEA